MTVTQKQDYLDRCIRLENQHVLFYMWELYYNPVILSTFSPKLGYRYKCSGYISDLEKYRSYLDYTPFRACPRWWSSFSSRTKIVAKVQRWRKIHAR